MKIRFFCLSRFEYLAGLPKLPVELRLPESPAVNRRPQAGRPGVIRAGDEKPKPASGVVMDTFMYFLDITGYCNLRCPSCPHGQQPWQGEKQAVMTEELFGRILKKIIRESPCPDTQLYLCNWGEATLHPQLPRFIEMAKAAGLPPYISSNLTRPLDLSGMVRARPKSLRISLSGYYPHTYGVTHRPGSIWLVKSNAYRLRALMEQRETEFPVEIFYHQYSHQGNDLEQVKKLASELSFNLITAWAFLMPLEKLLAVAGGVSGPEDEPLLRRFLVDPRVALPICRQQRSRFPECRLRSNSMALNADGTVGLCCATYAKQHQLDGNFMEASHQEIQDWRHGHGLCEQCRGVGADIYYQYGAQQEIEQFLHRVHAVSA